MAVNFMLPLRILQGVLAILVLSLSAFVASWFSKYNIYGSPSRVNFVIFDGVWTVLLVLPFLTITPRFFPRAAHPYAILGVEALTMLFWFAGFIALAVYVSGVLICRGNVCRCAQAATAFAAFEWILFLATAVMAVMHVMRSRNGGRSRTTPNAEI